MKRLLAIHLLSMLAAAQAFEVASVKPNKLTGARELRTDPGGLIASRMSLEDLLAAAYGVSRFQITGGPRWISPDLWDVQGKAGEPASRDQLMGMLQTLLAERFKLVLRRETRELAVYRLVIAKNRPALKQVQETDDPGKGVRLTGMVRLAGRMATTAQLTDAMTNIMFNGEHIVDRPVLDGTGLTGVYDFTLAWTPDFAQPSDPSFPPLFAAVQEQLGLKLEAVKAPVEMLVIDRAEKPPFE